MALDAAPRLGWLDRLLGAGGYEALARSRWRTFTVPTFLVGVVSDVMQVFGPFAYYLCLIALAITVVLGLSLLLRLPFRRQCIEPCALAFIAVVVFAAVLGLQRLNAAEDRGTLATTVPAVADLQEALRPLMERLGVVEEKLDALDEKVEGVASDTATLLTGQEELLALNRRQIELLEQEKGIPHNALVAHLVRLGADPAIELAEVPRFLERFAEEFVTLREQWQAQTGAEIDATREAALARLNEGDLDGARGLLRDARQQLREVRQERALAEATLLADEAAIERLDLRYRDAATLLAEAADLTAFEPETSWRHRLDQGNVLQDLGREFGDNAALVEAIATYETALGLAPRVTRPDGWAMTQNDLGNALATLGERESGTATLERAVGAFQAALEERTRERVPLGWAMTQNNLGTALGTLGERESDTATLERAVEAFEAALKEYTRERVPLNWAMTQNNLGNALAILGERESGTATLERAVEAYAAALEERTRERVPFPWALTQENVAIARLEIGRRRDDAEELRAALVAVDGALEVYRAGKAEFYIEEAGRLRARILAALEDLGG